VGELVAQLAADGVAGAVVDVAGAGGLKAAKSRKSRIQERNGVKGVPKTRGISA